MGWYLKSQTETQVSWEKPTNWPWAKPGAPQGWGPSANATAKQALSSFPSAIRARSEVLRKQGNFSQQPSGHRILRWKHYRGHLFSGSWSSPSLPGVPCAPVSSQAEARGLELPVCPDGRSAFQGAQTWRRPCSVHQLSHWLCVLGDIIWDRKHTS